MIRSTSSKKDLCSRGIIKNFHDELKSLTDKSLVKLLKEDPEKVMEVLNHDVDLRKRFIAHNKLFEQLTISIKYIANMETRFPSLYLSYLFKLPELKETNLIRYATPENLNDLEKDHELRKAMIKNQFLVTKLKELTQRESSITFFCNYPELSIDLCINCDESNKMFSSFMAKKSINIIENNDNIRKKILQNKTLFMEYYKTILFLLHKHNFQILFASFPQSILDLYLYSIKYDVKANHLLYIGKYIDNKEDILKILKVIEHNSGALLTILNNNILLLPLLELQNTTVLPVKNLPNIYTLLFLKHNIFATNKIKVACAKEPKLKKYITTLICEYNAIEPITAYNLGLIKLALHESYEATINKTILVSIEASDIRRETIPEVLTADLSTLFKKSCKLNKKCLTQLVTIDENFQADHKVPQSNHIPLYEESEYDGFTSRYPNIVSDILGKCSAPVSPDYI